MPMFTGGAGSGESEICRHVLENDLVEVIVALPTDMFYLRPTYLKTLQRLEANPHHSS